MQIQQKKNLADDNHTSSFMEKFSKRDHKNSDLTNDLNK